MNDYEKLQTAIKTYEVLSKYKRKEDSFEFHFLTQGGGYLDYGKFRIAWDDENGIEVHYRKKYDLENFDRDKFFQGLKEYLQTLNKRKEESQKNRQLPFGEYGT